MKSTVDFGTGKAPTSGAEDVRRAYRGLGWSAAQVAAAEGVPEWQAAAFMAEDDGACSLEDAAAELGDGPAVVQSPEAQERAAETFESDYAVPSDPEVGRQIYERLVESFARERRVQVTARRPAIRPRTGRAPHRARRSRRTTTRTARASPSADGPPGPPRPSSDAHPAAAEVR